jgi:hypothetical protein
MSEWVSQWKLPAVVLGVVMIVWNTAHYAGTTGLDGYDLPPEPNLKQRLAERQHRPATEALREPTASLELGD